MGEGSTSGLFDLVGWLGLDAYSTAWVALVPDSNNLRRPAWPQTLSFLRAHQLEDGGWGEPHIYFAHERTISTLAAIRALHAWKEVPEDAIRIERGLEALRTYADSLAYEPHEPVGFELLLPRLRGDLLDDFAQELPLDQWAPIDHLAREKLALIPHLRPDPDHPQAWWFSIEMLPDETLATFDDSILSANGSIVSSTAATAAYLRARRLADIDVPPAARYLDQALKQGDGGVPFSWPAEIFERIWALDSFRRAGMDPNSPTIASLVNSVEKSWYTNDPGLSSSDMFPVNDGDDTAVGFTILTWAGRIPSEEPLLVFWDYDHFRSYLDERSASVSANIHALTALRSQPGFPHKNLARRLTGWLVDQIQPGVIFEDKWHLSPSYLVSRAIPAFAGWHDATALQCTNFLVQNQRSDGGWGWYGRSNLEETAHSVLGLCEAYKQGLLTEKHPLSHAAHYLAAHEGKTAVESLYVGKTLFRSDGITESLLFSAKAALLEQLSTANHLSFALYNRRISVAAEDYSYNPLFSTTGQPLWPS